MIATFAYPSSSQHTGGVAVLYGFANALAARGHEIHFVHGPITPYRIATLDELAATEFHPAVVHHLADALDEPSLPEGDVVFTDAAPARMGMPCTFVQGFRMLPDDWERAAFRYPAPKVCVASWLVDVGRQLGVAPEQLWHIPQGIDHHLFTARTPQHRRSIDVAVLSHPHRNKGWDVALATLHELHRRRGALRSLVFGVDPPRGDLPRGTRFVHAPDQAWLATHVYDQARVFLQTSRVEGFGLTPVEAAACGAALVTTDNGGSRDYAIEGRTALVAPSEDVLALADATERLLDDDALRQRLSEAARAWVARFDWERSGALLEAHLDRYLRDPAAYRRPPGSALADPLTCS